jgi:transposase
METRTVKAFNGFLTWLGKARSRRCTSYAATHGSPWKPYLNVIHRRAGQALNVLDKFHIAAHLNKAAAETRRQTPPSVGRATT